MIPDHIKTAIDAWVFEAQVPGNFTKAVLENDLHKAVMGADPTVLPHLKDIVLYVINEVPAPCWGSKEKMSFWSNQGGQKGLHEARKRQDQLILGDQ